MEFAEGRMKKKVMGAVEAIDEGVGKVIFADGRVDEPITQARSPARARTLQLEHARPYAEIEERILGGTTARRGDVVITRGEGCWVFDEAGNKYLDLGSAQGVAMLGHCHPGVTAAIQAQAETLTLCPSYLYNDKRAEFAQGARRRAAEVPAARVSRQQRRRSDGRRAEVRAPVHEARRRSSPRPRAFTAGRWARCR